MEQLEKGRSNVQDMVKGALIIAVIFFHSCLYGNDNIYNEFNIIFCIFPCVMGVFFFYTGYNYTMGKRKPLDSIKRRTKQLLIPLVIMIFVSTILVGGLQLITKNTDMIGIWHSLKYFLLSKGGVTMWHADISKANYDLLLAVGLLWYLYVLYIISIIFYLIVDWTISRLRNLIIVVLPLLFISFLLGQFCGYWLPYSVQSYGLFLAIMLVAAYIKKLNLLDVPLDNKKNIIVTISLAVVFEGIIIGLGLLCYYAFGATTVGALPGGSLNETIKGFDVFVSFVMAILGTYVIHTLMRFLSKIKILSMFFGLVGKYVAIVYVTHPIFISYIHTLIFGRNFSVLGWFQPYMYTFITVAILIIIFVIIEIIKKKKQDEKEAIINEE